MHALYTDPTSLPPLPTLTSLQISLVFMSVHSALWSTKINQGHLFDHGFEAFG